MTFSENLKEFSGKKVVDHELGKKFRSPDKKAPRLRLDYGDEHSTGDLLEDLLANSAADQLTALVIGSWGQYMYESPQSAANVIEALTAAAPHLPNLTSLCFGDITYRECEISWIMQTDVSPLWSAFPKLEHFQVRGGNGLSLGTLELGRLRTLVVESGGLPQSVVRQVASSSLPALEHLELYLGTYEYGGYREVVEDLKPILSGEMFPRLRYLGLRNSEFADKVALAVVQSPLLERIETLDLSLGTLGDEGAGALAACPAVAQLKRLDVHHHYISAEGVQGLKALPVQLDASGREPDDEYKGEIYRYVAIGE